MKENQVKFTGRDYIAYLKYKDNKKGFFDQTNEWLKKDNNKIIFWVSFSVFIFTAVLFTMYQMYTYQPPVHYEYTWEGIGKFVAMCVGVGWVVHGVGFHLVKVN